MTGNIIINFITQSYFNPLLLSVYLITLGYFVNRDGIQIKPASNLAVLRLGLRPYLVLAPLMYLLWLLWLRWFLSYTLPAIQLTDLLALPGHWTFFPSTFIAAVMLSQMAKKNGIRCSIMELWLIYLPIYSIALGLQVGLHLHWLNQQIQGLS
jgi:hypothetical protein